MVTKTTYHQIFTDLGAEREPAQRYRRDATPAKVRALLLDRGYNV